MRASNTHQVSGSASELRTNITKNIYMQFLCSTWGSDYNGQTNKTNTDNIITTSQFHSTKGTFQLEDNTGAKSIITALGHSTIHQNKKESTNQRYLRPKVLSSAFVCICLKQRRHKAKTREEKTAWVSVFEEETQHLIPLTWSFHIQLACTGIPETTVTLVHLVSSCGSI